MKSSYEGYNPTNREKKFVPKRGRFYCNACDISKVGVGERCPICHNLHKNRSLKKYYI